MSKARNYCRIEGNFKMRHGALRDPVLAYETWGELNHHKDNAILLF
ncbi:MAG: homoserine O-acetyltransferase, partial [Pseudomonadales bacterium]|nr:homoserine O-acetyltransferase [Pseudomonadales bacterium]